MTDLNIHTSRYIVPHIWFDFLSLSTPGLYLRLVVELIHLHWWWIWWCIDDGFSIELIIPCWMELLHQLKFLASLRSYTNRDDTCIQQPILFDTNDSYSVINQNVKKIYPKSTFHIIYVFQASCWRNISFTIYSILYNP